MDKKMAFNFIISSDLLLFFKKYWNGNKLRSWKDWVFLFFIHCLVGKYVLLTIIDSRFFPPEDGGGFRGVSMTFG